jgi:hypothetical protein
MKILSTPVIDHQPLLGGQSTIAAPNNRYQWHHLSLATTGLLIKRGTAEKRALIFTAKMSPASDA